MTLRIERLVSEENAILLVVALHRSTSRLARLWSTVYALGAGGPLQRIGHPLHGLSKSGKSTGQPITCARV